MCLTAHPDDESLGFGGTLARYAAEGVEVSLVVGTRGERGRFGDGSDPHPGSEALGRIREREVRAASEILGVKHVRFLDYVDAELDRAPAREAASRVAAAIRELRPDVALTFDPFGGYGHPDHIAIAQFATAGIMLAGSEESPPGAGREPHQVRKLYYAAWTDRVWHHYQKVFKVLQMTVGDELRQSVSWPDWSVSATADAFEHWETVWEAVQCHRTQMAQYGALTELTDEDHHGLWGPQEYYRVFSLVNSGREKETDLFAGLR